MSSNGTVNRVTIVGNLGRDPEVRTTQAGGKIATLSVATSETWKDKEGTRQERVEWHKVVILDDKLVGVAERYLRKGSKVYIEGALQTRKWEAEDGSTRFSTEVVLQSFRSVLTVLDAKETVGSA